MSTFLFWVSNLILVANIWLVVRAVRSSTLSMAQLRVQCLISLAIWVSGAGLTYLGATLAKWFGGLLFIPTFFCYVLALPIFVFAFIYKRSRIKAQQQISTPTTTSTQATDSVSPEGQHTI